ncbi:hypothetical protein GP486_001069 [Trichoglossum hirsutum]|uniref:Bicarbonate transporter-like transmembrane domain-containing protein n=1 Tax=Trichoglossum hirsutum TaxID=265104 RepID=A0A9P8LHD4_9PEZI|nr:hypothetical protein GP486_001069 [Trichoglossum hirsutum]
MVQTTEKRGERQQQQQGPPSSISTKRRSRGAWPSRLRFTFIYAGPLKPFRLLQQDVQNFAKRYRSDWKIFNQLVFASAVYVFFTNLLPGITFASDLYNLTGENWGTIEVVFSTGLCGVIFSLWVASALSK